MHSPCTREASEACLRACFPMPLPGLPEPESNPVSIATAAALRYQFEVAMVSFIHPNSYFTNHESLPSLEESFSNFTATFPQYTATDQADKIREEEYYHLGATDHVCLDYIGHGLFSYSQLQSYSTRDTTIASTSYSSPPFLRSTSSEWPFFDISYRSVDLNSQIKYGAERSDLECKFRKRIMSFMNISEDDYTLVFTSNESSAFKLVADSYPFQSNPRLLTVYDHENEAVKLMIESSKKRGSIVMSAEFMWPNLKVLSEKLRKKVVGKRKKRNRGLFVFPLQSRMTGTRYSYLWMNMAQENGWHVLLDACALGPKHMETLGLSIFKPDFLVCSFFKVFGENPSGFGCLFVKKSSASVLQDSSTATGMGIVRLVPHKPPSEQLEQSGSTDTESEQKAILDLHDNGFVQGSSSGITSSHQKMNETDELDEVVGETSITQKEPEIEELETLSRSTTSKTIKDGGLAGNSPEPRGLDHADTVGLILISSRARYLTNWLVNALLSLRHPHSGNGHSLVQIYGPKIKFNRAPAVTFNIIDWKGDKVDPILVQKLAGRYNISLSYGILSHISFSEKYSEEKEQLLEKRTSERGVVSNEKTGISVVTAALGFLTNFEDIYRLWAFVSRFLDADFAEKERWRYTALNQKIVEV